MHLLKPTNRKFVSIVLVIVLVVALVSWTIPLPTTIFNEFAPVNDTVPTRSQKMKDINDAISKLNNAKDALNEQVITAEVAQALRQINLEEVKEALSIAVCQTKTAVAQINTKKVADDVEIALSKIDKEKIDERVKAALALLQPQLEETIAETKQQLERARQELERAKQELRTKS